ncbi:MAG: transglycosylase SLT domain-containing protein [Holophagales bacterium]|nr:MAG: transglycosylase SLT domain-containing protein [Holophagales bacterium]
MMLFAALALTAALGTPDPRPVIAEQVRRGEIDAALGEVQAGIAADRNPASSEGLRLLEGRLLLAKGHIDEARRALERSIGDEPTLAPWAHQELGEIELAAGAPERAAGRFLLVLGSSTDRRLRERAHAGLRRSAEAGGGCRAVLGALPSRLERDDFRRLKLLASECALAAGDLATVAERWKALLVERDDDRVAQEIVDRLARRELAGLPLPTLPPDRLGLAYARQRDFERAIRALEPALASAQGPRAWELALTLARSRFWAGDHLTAARELERLATQPLTATSRAEALFYAARARELAGDAAGALADHRAAELAAPRGGWSDASRFAQVRLASQAGDEREAISAIARFGPGRDAASARARSLLTLAVNDLVAGRGDRAEAWLAQALRAEPGTDREVAYWQGRLAELRGRQDEALLRYRRAFDGRPHHPFAEAAVVRLQGQTLRPSADASAAQLLQGDLPDRIRGADLARALGSLATGAGDRLAQAIRSDPRYARFAALSPLWPPPGGTKETTPEEPTKRLLRLGLWREGAAAAGLLSRGDLAAALAASMFLLEAGEPSAAMALAERVGGAAPRGLGESQWPLVLRRLVLPLPYRERLLAAATRHRVDPALLAAILREESRFDPRAFSPAAARGLGQFVLPTARRLAAQLGLTDFAASALDQPDVAIELAAAHLAELLERFEGRPELAVAAYNAGEPQAEAWARSCRTAETAELLSRVSFRETRGYLARVLEARGRYREIADWPSIPTP